MATSLIYGIIIISAIFTIYILWTDQKFSYILYGYLFASILIFLINKFMRKESFIESLTHSFDPIITFIVIIMILIKLLSKK